MSQPRHKRQSLEDENRCPLSISSTHIPKPSLSLQLPNVPTQQPNQGIHRAPLNDTCPDHSPVEMIRDSIYFRTPSAQTRIPNRGSPCFDDPAVEMGFCQPLSTRSGSFRRNNSGRVTRRALQTSPVARPWSLLRGMCAKDDYPKNCQSARAGSPLSQRCPNVLPSVPPSRSCSRTNTDSSVATLVNPEESSRYSCKRKSFSNFSQDPGSPGSVRETRPTTWGPLSSEFLPSFDVEPQELFRPGSNGGEEWDYNEKHSSKEWSQHYKPASRKDSDKLPTSEVRVPMKLALGDTRQQFLMKMCCALMRYGAPTHRLEEYLQTSSRLLEIEASFLYIPGCMLLSFDGDGDSQAGVKIVRTKQGLDLGRLFDVHKIYKETAHDHAELGNAMDRLDEIMNRPDKFSVHVRILMYGFASACVAPFAFEARFSDLPPAFALGSLIGSLELFAAPHHHLFANIFEISCAFITSFVSRALGSVNGGELFCFSALSQSSIALILPGYMVLCASLELQSHNIVSGSLRIVYSLVYTFFLSYGITIGSALYGLIDETATSATVCRQPPNPMWNFFFVPCFALCLAIINQAKWQQVPVMVVIAMVGYIVNNILSVRLYISSPISNTIAAFCVGVMANLHSRMSRVVAAFLASLWKSTFGWIRRRIRFRMSHSRNNSISSRTPFSSRSERHASFGGQSRMRFQMNGRSRSQHSDRGRRGSASDCESFESSSLDHSQRPLSYGSAAAAMLPAIFVQVPSGLAASGSLLAGVTSADVINNVAADDSGSNLADMSRINNLMASVNSTAFTVLYSVVQVAIGIAVGLFISSFLVYPLGKRRGGLFSF